jgi:eukaryotic-like serine/threonine-protein kinase
MSISPLREEDVFDAARQLKDAAARSAFLDGACAHDPAMRERLEALLSAESEAETFFAETSCAINASADLLDLPLAVDAGDDAATHGLTPPGEEPLGSRIGRYKLLQKLGEGGCGVVYLAEQEEPVRRRVALKIIKLGMETKSVIARFEAERQALAMMDHPHIARVFDAGATDRGPPYFVMELVTGVKITTYCDQHRLDTNQRLNLFIQICHAIQHAHQKGIIHGDIKPSNILVTLQDGVPMPKVIDFGISRATEARLTDKLLFTAYTQLVGTPAYMSPEQAEMSTAGIDTRSDIYSLGVLLYELLTGRTPFDPKELLEAGLDEMRRILREREPPRPSMRLASLPGPDLATTAENRRFEPLRLIASLRGDLDWIVMKALEKDRTRRYETANGFAMDVQRYLDHEPVLARPASWTYRLRKLVRRNRVVFIAGGAIAAALMIGTGVSTWLFLKERESRQRAVAAEQQQARLRYEAEMREKITYAALLVSQEKFGEADRVVSEITFTQPTLEGAAVLRAVGEWHALHNQWREAVDRFTVLLRVNRLDGSDVSTLDYLEQGPTLLEAGDVAGYERFRQDAIDRFSGTPLPGADRIVKICLLLPANRRVLESLTPLVQSTTAALHEADANGDVFQAAWRSVSLALWEYRCGNYERAAEWSRRCIAYPEHNAPRAATARVILAMSLHQLQRGDDAVTELTAARDGVGSKLRGRLEKGTPIQGFWFDWAFAHILLQEAVALIEPQAG